MLGGEIALELGSGFASWGEQNCVLFSWMLAFICKTRGSLCSGGDSMPPPRPLYVFLPLICIPPHSLGHPSQCPLAHKSVSCWIASAVHVAHRNSIIAVVCHSRLTSLRTATSRPDSLILKGTISSFVLVLKCSEESQDPRASIPPRSVGIWVAAIFELL